VGIVGIPLDVLRGLQNVVQSCTNCNGWSLLVELWNSVFVRNAGFQWTELSAYHFDELQAAARQKTPAGMVHLALETRLPTHGGATLHQPPPPTPTEQPKSCSISPDNVLGPGCGQTSRATRALLKLVHTHLFFNSLPRCCSRHGFGFFFVLLFPIFLGEGLLCLSLW
jgi:hypothetical protein